MLTVARRDPQGETQERQIYPVGMEWEVENRGRYRHRLERQRGLRFKRIAILKLDQRGALFGSA